MPKKKKNQISKKSFYSPPIPDANATIENHSALKTIGVITKYILKDQPTIKTFEIIQKIIAGSIRPGFSFKKKITK